ncbi:ComF family protein [Pseudanabaena sp. PCC 6802]|uniref:ComF family protein n=1 Tax=Pseudanabaena sp. PCC 6802 TaxID=118173 RepID=UPI00034BAD84|nr:ComF family protein [Pseudanabaena sp. PCC 6802]
MWQKLNFVLGKCLDGLLESKCPLCQRSTPDRICGDCDRQITSCRYPQFCQPQPSALVPMLFSWGVYDGALKRAIAACKYERHPAIATLLGVKMAQAWQQDPMAKQLLQPRSGSISAVPIPLHPQRLQARGFNQAEVLASSFCAEVGYRCFPQALIRTKNTKPQIETKNIRERESNLARAFEIGKISGLGKSVILVDDIYTSGSTIREAIATLAGSNITVSAVVVLAKPKL